ncbi:Capsid protein (F protein) [Chlamydia trachomatis]|nr:Capsid protein (F protein) [Chlamydia trachomatis]
MSLFKLPTPHTRLSRNGYDLSSKKVFSAPVGALVPIGAWECNPGEKFHIKVEDLTRTQPLNTAAFARIKEYYHFFAVPIKSLWLHSDRFFTGVTEGDTAFSKPTDKTDFNFVPRSVPTTSMKDLISLLHASDEKFISPFANNAVVRKWKQYLELEEDEREKLPLIPKLKSSFHPTGADINGGTFGSGDGNHSHFGIDKEKLADAIKEAEKIPEDLVPYVKMFKDAKLSNKDALGYSYKYGAFRLLHHLEYGIDNNGMIPQYGKSHWHTPIQELLYNKKTYKVPDVQLNVFRLLAYQRIYNDFYRDTNWEKPQPQLFNVDWCNSNDNLRIDATLAYQMCQLRYRHWSKDWLTSAYPTAQFDKAIFDLPSYIGSNGNVGSSSNQGVYSYVDTDTHSDVSISTNDIRAMFALERMLEKTRAANGLDYTAQIAAHYGFNVPDSRKNVARYIGGFDNTINISEVVTTSNGTIDGTEDTSSVVGQVFGKGTGAMASNKIEYEAKEHCIIMCIYSAAPQIDYDARNISPFNRKFTREDYFQPEFENLGYQPLIQSDLALVSGDDDADVGEALKKLWNTKLNNNVLGYSPRYLEYKTARDQVFGEFMQGGDLSVWCTPKPCTTEKIGKLSLPDLLVDPNIVFPIFSLRYNGEMNTDHLIINSYFDVKAIRPMSINNLSVL